MTNIDQDTELPPDEILTRYPSLASVLSPSRAGNSEQERARRERQAREAEAWRKRERERKRRARARAHCAPEACLLRHTQRQAPYMRALVFVGGLIRAGACAFTWPLRRPA